MQAAACPSHVRSAAALARRPRLVSTGTDERPRQHPQLSTWKASVSCLGELEIERWRAVHRPVEVEDFQRDVRLEVRLAEERDDLPACDPRSLGSARCLTWAHRRRWWSMSARPLAQLGALAQFGFPLVGVQPRVLLLAPGSGQPAGPFVTGRDRISVLPPSGLTALGRFDWPLLVGLGAYRVPISSVGRRGSGASRPAWRPPR
jgi:hypothetical protein